MSHRFVSTGRFVSCAGLISLGVLALGTTAVAAQARGNLPACSISSTFISLTFISSTFISLTFKEEAQAERSTEALFADEIQQVASKLKWHGESLPADTAYAAALTGLSWETGWGKEHLFSLAWGELRRVPGYRPHNKSYAATVREIQSGFERRDYRRVVSLASESFSLDEIACDPNLKEAVAQSFLELRQPERAFPLFAAPFEPFKSVKELVKEEDRNARRDERKSALETALETAEVDRRCRQGAYEAAQRAGLRKETIAFGLSLLFDPGVTPLSSPPLSPPLSRSLNVGLLHSLEAQGVDMDRLILGILQSPDHLHGLPNFAYPAADLLAIRATPRHLPFLLHLATLDDVYLHTRALVGLGVIAYRSRRDDPPGWAARILPITTLREYGISSGQRKRIVEEVEKATRSDQYRIRAAACLTLALMGDEADVPQLQKLTKDRAYLLTSDNDHAPNVKNVKSVVHRIQYPVRQSALTALARFGIHVELPVPPDRDLVGKDLDLARRGGQDVTNDHRYQRSQRKENAEGIIDLGF